LGGIGMVLARMQTGAGNKQTLGFLTLLGDILESLDWRLVRYWPVFIEMTIGLTSVAQACVTGLEEEETNVEEVEGILDNWVVSEDTIDSSSPSPPSPKLEAIRGFRPLLRVKSAFSLKQHHIRQIQTKLLPPPLHSILRSRRGFW
jgi:hypothetical protein